jgi:endonuclease/exonuclease/phosphatase family metal-dependent hydrolase
MSELVQPKEKGFARKLTRRIGAGALALSSLLYAHGDISIDPVLSLQGENQAPFDGDELLFMTANVHSWQGINMRKNTDTFLAAVKEYQPDVGCLQEVNADSGELQRLQKLGYHVIFAQTWHSPLHGRQGNAVMSKYPISLAQKIKLPHHITNTRRNMMVVELDTAEGPRTIANTHLSISLAESDMQVATAEYKLDRYDVLCGDTNRRPDRMEGVQLFRSGRGMRAESITPTFPANDPVHQIDYIIDDCDYWQPGFTVDIDSDHLAYFRGVQLDCD